MYKLGVAYYEGQVVDKDKDKGLDLILKSAKRGYVHAQFYISTKILYPEDIERSQAESAKWVKKSAEQLVFSAHAFTLSGLYKYGGPGIEKNLDKYKKWRLNYAFLTRQERCNK